MRAKFRGPRPRWAFAASLFAGAFGLATVAGGGGVLFSDGDWRRMMGDIVGFVVWFNFVMGFVYLAGAVGLALWRSWVVGLAWAIALSTGVVALGFMGHIWMGGAFEWRTAGALAFRMLFWFGVAVAAGGSVSRRWRSAMRRG